MIPALLPSDAVSIRGFGASSLRIRKSRVARNPSAGEPVAVLVKRVPYFRPGKALRERVDFTQ